MSIPQPIQCIDLYHPFFLNNFFLNKWSKTTSWTYKLYRFIVRKLRYMYYQEENHNALMHCWIVPPLPSTVVNTVIMSLQLFP